MKKIVQAIFLLSCIYGKAQIINIPDANFKAKLLSANTTTSTIAAYGTPPNFVITKIDTNDNGEIEQSEVQNITYLNVSASNIINLIGIEYFVNLKYFLCGQNNLTTTININGLIQLERIFFNQNQLTDLNLTSFPDLKILGCQNNPISSLDFSSNNVLEHVSCVGTLVSELDFSNNPQFVDLACKNNPNLTAIKIKNGAQQVFGSGTYYPADCWSNCPNLNYICADANEIAPLQTYLSNCAVSTSGITINSDCVLSVEEYDFASIKVYPNPNDGIFTINFDSIVDEAEIQVYTLVGQLIYQEKVINTSEKLLNIGRIASGAYLLKINSAVQTLNKRIIIK